MEPHLREQVYELAKLTAAAREVRARELEARKEAQRLEEKARALGRRAWLQDELHVAPIGITLDDGALVTISPIGHRTALQHPRITIAEPVGA